MADNENTQKQENSEQKEKQEGQKSSMTFWLILAATISLCAIVGMVGGSIIAKSQAPEQAAEQELEPVEQKVELELTGESDGKTWFYEIEPVTANLDEPAVTRYIRAVITLEIGSEVEETQGIAFIDEKKPILKDWLTIYLSSQTLQDIRGERNLRRVQAEIRDHFNEELFGEGKTYIQHVLFKEFAVQ